MTIDTSLEMRLDTIVEMRLKIKVDMTQNIKRVSFRTINPKLQEFIMIMITLKDPLRNHRLPTTKRNISITTLFLLRSSLFRDRTIN